MLTSHKRRGVFVATLAATAGLLTAVPAAASPGDGPSARDSRGDVEFSVFDTGTKIPRDASFKLADLSGRYGVAKSAVEELGAGRTPRQEASEQRTLAGPDDIVGEWKERDGWNTVMRRGYYDPALDRGFGLTKVDQKHNLSLAAVKATTKYPRPGASGKEPLNGSSTTYNYRTEVLHIKCSGWWIFRTCRVVDVKTIRAGVDFRVPPGGDGKSKGVITAFCEGVPGRCPDWVRNSINI
ncbi:hypothetical protein [Streptomyces griseocarneus]|uniref:hypothetical protein n=1 Tax=Streptomyces griseocarneus TaxID=51201 RepID=UPI00167EDBA1|nr:hypothetical protein [Streptomyces griseocarneus]MBZ6475987.1 hypothetical protein [Streptomyces griseocarneus]GHG49705.1 hypothetical protein GCM10018779_09030 [Streptomyces griseocarneus]